MLPIGIVLPTRNSASLLPAHLESMRGWLDHVEEVVVVDSSSNDGTLELLKGLRHPRIRFLDHPPGLYQSWNYGVQQIRSEFCYISTVGESASLAGLQHLARTMIELRCDLVISRPKFIRADGRLMRAPGWPIDDIIRTLGLTTPQALEGAGLFFLALVHYRNALLGSSASNLYRTATLQARPFPTQFGTVGDGAWGLQHCLEVRLGVTPEIFSTFRQHPKSYSASEYRVDQLPRKLFEAILGIYQEEARRNPAFSSLASQLRVEELVGLLAQQLLNQRSLENSRRSILPWVLSPAAWEIRARRQTCARKITHLKEAGVKLLFARADLGGLPSQRPVR